MNVQGTILTSSTLSYFHSGRADIMSTLAVGMPLGGMSMDFPSFSTGNGLIYTIVFDKKGKKGKKHRRRQIVYPSPVYPELLFGLGLENSNVSNVSVEFNGTVSFKIKGKKYRGLLGYEVIPGRVPLSGGVEFTSLGSDRNGDGITDFGITYPSGEVQDLLIIR